MAGCPSLLTAPRTFHGPLRCSPELNLKERPRNHVRPSPGRPAGKRLHPSRQHGDLLTSHQSSLRFPVATITWLGPWDSANSGQVPWELVEL